MRNQTATFSGGTTAVSARTGRAPGPVGMAAITALAAVLLLGAGCGKSGEAKITGSRAAGPVSLACAWQPGYAYHLRLDTEIVTETEGADAQNAGRHRVTYGHECLVRVTNSPRAGNLELEVEVISLEMERAKNEAVALCYNSEQGGETVDDLGYIPVLKKMIGGHLRFSVSPGGKLVRFDGVTDWLNNALGAKTVSRSTTVSRVKTVLQQPPPGTPGSPQPVEVLSEDSAVRRVEFPPGRSVTNVPGAPGRIFTALPANPPRAPSGGADTVGRTLRGFFNTDLFRTFLEFRFLPSAPVRVGDEWKEQGDTPITSRNNRIKYDAQCTFAGWQQHGGTNCARIDAVGKRAAQMPPGNATRKSGAKTGLDGTVWVNTGLAFPATTVLDKETVLPGDTNTRMIGTNSVTTTTGPKFIREHVTITLLKAIPPETPSTSSDTSPSPGSSN
jgi:hypothetical protein